MQKFLTDLPVYSCLTCFGLSFIPSSEAGVQLRQWFKSPEYGVSAMTFIEYFIDMLSWILSSFLPDFYYLRLLRYVI
jgi:hypothetical protein